MDYEYINLNVDCSLTYVYDDDSQILPLERGMNILPYSTIPVTLDKGFTFRHLLEVFANYPVFEDLFFCNYLSITEMSTDHVPNNDLNYISISYGYDCIVEPSGSQTQCGYHANFEVCSGMEGKTFSEFTNYSLGEVIDLPMIMTNKNQSTGFSLNMPMGSFVQAAIDAMSLCDVGVTTD